MHQINPKDLYKKRTKNKDKKRRRNRYRSHLNFQGRDADCWIGKAVQARPYFLFGLEQRDFTEELLARNWDPKGGKSNMNRFPISIPFPILTCGSRSTVKKLRG